MFLLKHHRHHLLKEDKVVLFVGAQRILFEERNYFLSKFGDRTDTVTVEVFVVVIVALVYEYLPAAEIRLYFDKRGQALRTLRDHEFRKYLLSESRRRVLDNRDGKTSLPVSKASDPASNS